MRIRKLARLLVAGAAIIAIPAYAVAYLDMSPPKGQVRLSSGGSTFNAAMGSEEASSLPSYGSEKESSSIPYPGSGKESSSVPYPGSEAASSSMPWPGSSWGSSVVNSLPWTSSSLPWGGSSLPWGGSSQIAGIPEPSTWMMMVLGFFLIGGVRYRAVRRARRRAESSPESSPATPPAN